MIKHHLYVTIFVVMLSIAFQACTDSENDFNRAGLYGSWEVVDFREDHGLNQVNSLVLNRDGTYQKSITFRDPDTDAIVGYYHFQNGTFVLAGATIAFEAEKDLYIGNEAAWGTMEELTEMEISSDAQPVISTLEFREKGSKLAVITECNDLLLSMCAPHPVYSRVNT